MFRLNFKTKVMGEEGAAKVRRHEVTQTLRSPRSGIVVALLNSTLVIEEVMEVALDDEVVGRAYPMLIDRIDWDTLTLLDATRAGFSNKPEVYAALSRAGYQPVTSYLFYRVQFGWLNDTERSES